MKRTLLLLLLSAGISLHAQETWNHELALDAAPLLLKSSPDLTVLYRHQMNGMALRAQALFAFQSNNDNTDNNTTTPANLNSTASGDITSDYFHLQLRLGIQKNIPVDKWMAYAGLDALFDYTTNEASNETRSPAAYGTTRNTSAWSSVSRGYGLAPVLGLGYNLHSRVFVSLENSFIFMYSMNSSENTNKYYFTAPKGVEALNSTATSSSEGSSTRFDFSPSTCLRLLVAFRF